MGAQRRRVPDARACLARELFLLHLRDRRPAVERAERLDDRGHAGVGGAGHHDLHRVDGRDQLDRGIRIVRHFLRHGVRVVGGQPPAGAARDGLLARAREVPVGAPALLRDGGAHVGLGPAVLVEEPGVFRVQHDVAAGPGPHQRAGAAQRVGEVRRELLGSRGVPGLDVQHRADDGRGDGAVVRADVVVRGQAWPGGVLLVLRDAAGVLGGRALGGLVEHVRLEAEAVDRAEPDRPADRRVGAEPRSPHVAAGVQPEPLPGRPVDHDERGGPCRGLPDRPGDHAVAQERVPRGQHDGEVLRQAAGERRVDRGQPHGEVLVEVRHGDEHLVRVATGRGQELREVGLGDRDDGQPVGPAAGVVVVDRPACLSGVDVCHARVTAR